MARQELAPGLLIAFEGLDGSGKSTQARSLAAWLRKAGFEVLETREPTDGPHGRRLRASATTGRLTPEEELQEFVADRRQHVAETIAPARSAGAIVILDRYYYSTAAYQGARGLDPQAILVQNEAFAPRPEVVVFLEISIDRALARIGSRGDGDNLFERRENLERCAAIFATFDGPHFHRIDGDRPEAEVHRDIIHIFTLPGTASPRDCR